MAAEIYRQLQRQTKFEPNFISLYLCPGAFGQLWLAKRDGVNSRKFNFQHKPGLLYRHRVRRLGVYFFFVSSLAIKVFDIFDSLSIHVNFVYATASVEIIWFFSLFWSILGHEALYQKGSWQRNNNWIIKFIYVIKLNICVTGYRQRELPRRWSHAKLSESTVHQFDVE